MREYINIFADKIRNTGAIDELIKVENFNIDNIHKGYLYAYKTARGIHIETSVSVGDCNFTDFINYSDMYCGHTLHEYLIMGVIDDKNITLENRIYSLLEKTILQLDILTLINRNNVKESKAAIL